MSNPCSIYSNLSAMEVRRSLQPMSFGSIRGLYITGSVKIGPCWAGAKEKMSMTYRKSRVKLIISEIIRLILKIKSNKWGRCTNYCVDDLINLSIIIFSLCFYNCETFPGRIHNKEIEKSIRYTPYSYDIFHLSAVHFNYFDISKK